MDNPVLASDGLVYEKDALISLIKEYLAKGEEPKSFFSTETLKNINGSWFTAANDVKGLIERYIEIKSTKRPISFFQNFAYRDIAVENTSPRP
jgi:hypothetical protein